MTGQETLKKTEEGCLFMQNRKLYRNLGFSSILVAANEVILMHIINFWMICSLQLLRAPDITSSLQSES